MPESEQCRAALDAPIATSGRPGARHLPRVARVVCILGLLLSVIAGGVSWSAPRTENVIVAVIDGARYTETFGDPLHRYIPNIWHRLRPKGTIHTRFYNRGETITPGAHASMLTGNDCWIWHGNPIEGVGIDSQPATPTLFEHFRAATGAGPEEAWMIANHNRHLETMTCSTHPDYGSDYAATWHFGSGLDRRLWREVAAIMDQHHPRVMLINFHQTDKAGHEMSWRRYVQHIFIADWIVYAMWQKIQRHPFYADRTMLIVTSDHGRHTDEFYHHGDCCEGCQHVMFLALGPDIRQGHTVDDVEHRLHDIAPTTAALLGLSMPHAVDGQVMDEILRDGVLTAAESGTDEPGLFVDALTLGEEGQPQDVFRPGDPIGLELTVCNPGAAGVDIFQQKLGWDTCSTGRNYRNIPIHLEPGECYTEVEYRDLPLVTPAGAWSFDVSYRALDSEGNVVDGVTTVSVTIQDQPVVSTRDRSDLPRQRR
jgi:hypothetical protein